MVKIMSERSSPREKASDSISRLSPTMDTHRSWIPRAGNLVAIHAALVSVNSPIKSSVPMEIISAFK